MSDRLKFVNIFIYPPVMLSVGLGLWDGWSLWYTLLSASVMVSALLVTVWVGVLIEEGVQLIKENKDGAKKKELDDQRFDTRAIRKENEND